MTKPYNETTVLAVRLRQVTRLLNVSERTVRLWVKEGRIPHMRVGRTLLFPVAELQRWLTTQAVGQTPDASSGLVPPEKSQPADLGERTYTF